jgi:hypothetical protein
MSRLTVLVVALGLLFACQEAQAQSWEASAFVGYTPGVDIDLQASELNQLDVRGAFTWGVQGRLLTLGRRFVDAAKSALEGGPPSGAFDFFTMTVRPLQGNVFYEFGAREAKVRPFVSGGIGATFFSAADLQSETKLSFHGGGGLNYFAWRNIGMRVHARFKPTLLDDTSAGDFCDPFGFCQSWLSQFEFGAGAVVRF